LSSGRRLVICLGGDRTGLANSVVAMRSITTMALRAPGCFGSRAHDGGRWRRRTELYSGTDAGNNMTKYMYFVMGNNPVPAVPIRVYTRPTAATADDGRGHDYCSTHHVETREYIIRTTARSFDSLFRRDSWGEP